MSRKTYRICLVVLIMAAIAGGLWYYQVFMRHPVTPTEGTLVWNETEVSEKI